MSSVRDMQLSATQLEALRKLEAWAAADIPEGGLEEESEDVRYTAETGAFGEVQLAAHRAEAPAGAVVATRTAYELEHFSMRVEEAVHANILEKDRRHLDQLRSRERCCVALVGELKAMVDQLNVDATRCATVKEESLELVSSLELESRKLHEEEALAQALKSQLQPLREAQVRVWMGFNLICESLCGQDGPGGCTGPSALFLECGCAAIGSRGLNPTCRRPWRANLMSLSASRAVHTARTTRSSLHWERSTGAPRTWRRTHIGK